MRREAKTFTCQQIGRAWHWTGYALHGALVSALGLLCVVWLGLAASADIYEIKGLGVDATAKDAQQAKIAALQSGQVAAFNLLVKRLAVVDDPASLPEFTSAEISRLLAGLTIEQEKTSPTRYIAKLTVRFRSALVKEFLGQFNIPFADTQAPNVLLIAIWQGRAKQVLWDTPNPWRDAWGKVDAGNSITPILLPLGDLTDISILSVEDIIQNNQEKIGQLKGRYGTDHLLIAKARLDQTGTKISVDIRGESPMGMVEFVQTYPVTGKDVVGTAFRAAKDFLSALEIRWKQDHQNASSTAGTVYALTVPFTSLQEWQALRTELTATRGVGSVEIKSLSARGALVNVRFNGTSEVLANALAARGLLLTNVGAAWVLERR